MAARGQLASIKGECKVRVWREFEEQWEMGLRVELANKGVGVEFSSKNEFLAPFPRAVDVLLFADSDMGCFVHLEILELHFSQRILSIGHCKKKKKSWLTGQDARKRSETAHRSTMGISSKERPSPRSTSSNE